ncbi:MAG: hypothetical protein AB7O97_15640 [Planctomycetota bacterium]
MRRWLVAMALLAPGTAMAQDGGAAALDRASCAVCHPGAAKGLRQSPHAALWLQSATRPHACTSCHGDLAGHVAAASRPGDRAPSPVPAVQAAACAACHPGRERDPAAGRHPLRDLLHAAALPRPEAAADAQRTEELAAAARGEGVDWSGLVDFGYRFVHVAGSRDGYATDVDLEPGARLRALELRGEGVGADAPFDDLALQAHDVGDPRWSAGLRAREDDLGEVDVAFLRDRLHYAGGGDFHRVDRTAEAWTTDVEVELGAGLRAFAAFRRHDDEGFWLTQRIGNRNVSVQSFVDGVDSPRRARASAGEVGLRGEVDDWNWAVAALLREDRSRDQWRYARPAPANPAFDETEDFTSRTSLRGPGARLRLDGDGGPWTVALTAQVFDHDRRVVADGTSSGFDIAQFDTVTSAVGDGTARTSLIDLATTLALGDALVLVLDAHWRDHREDLSLRQFDVTTFPTLSTTVTVDTDVDQHTAQRLFDGSAVLEWRALDALELALGYGAAREWLRVPDLDPGDPRDFRRGQARDDGVVARARWRPCDGITVRGEWRDFGQDGALLHELAPERAREASGSVAFVGGDDDGDGRTANATVFVRHRRNTNDVADHRLDALSTGVTAGAAGRELSCDVGYTFARIDSETRTSFYFDPDPNPVPTLVGFDGDTHTVHGSFVAQPSGDLRWEFTGACTRTTGDFAVSFLDWRADVRWQLDGERRAFGTEFRMGRYRADGGLFDWDAQGVFVYWRQVF